MSSKVYNWAILGCGHIANKFASDLKLLPNARLFAAASRSAERANEFASKWGFEKAYGSYRELVEDPDVDIVYIATPHSHHFEHTTLCLNHGKAVLCEKAFSLNANEVLKMVETAKANHTFLMEAFWTRFQPSFIKALDILQSGQLGEVKQMRSDFAFNAPFVEERRLYNVELGGGSLLDIGIYPVFAALSVLGVPDVIKSFADFSSTGAEESIGMLLKYSGGKMAVLTSSLGAYSSIQTEFMCERGYLILNPRWYTPTTLTIWKEGDTQPSHIACDHSEGWGYQYEAAHVMECLEQGLIESPVMTWQKSIDLMQVLDRIRVDAGIFFPGRDSRMFF